MDYLAPLWGQEQAREILNRGIKEDRISHAYLFLGPEGVGKFTVARAFAYQLIAAADPRAKLYFQENMHPDLLILEKPAGKKMVAKEQISKELKPWLAIKPYRARKKIAIIRDSHHMSAAAANALLKMLEEPPSYAVIILIADQDQLLKTIISRCQPIRFHLIADRFLEEYFSGQGFDPQQARRRAQIAQGSMATAVLLAAEEDESLWSEVQDIVKALAGGGEIEIFRSADIIEKHPLLAVNLLATILRDLQIYMHTGSSEGMIITDNVELAKILPGLDEAKLSQGVTTLNHWKKHYRDNTNSLLLSIKISYIIKDALQ